MPRRSRELTARQQQALVAALTRAECYEHEIRAVRAIETHISWVLLTGRYAYKIKKAITLPFLDFGTLARRRHFCAEELRLNHRLASALYLAVVPIGGSIAAPRVGRTPALEYAVQMVQFDGNDEIDVRLARQAVPRAAFVEFAARLARFHSELRPLRSHTGSTAARAALDNLATLVNLRERAVPRELAALRAWTVRECKRLASTLQRRAANGAHRECHGDLHLKNLLWRHGSIVAFDALEFDRTLREIDVISEAAFTTMDLIAADRVDLAYAFLNAYLEATGDYDGVHVLRFYLVYRALVRAKVGALTAAQTGRATRADPYLRTALELAAPARPLLLITHGLSGSGKTQVTTELVSRLPALRVRSDLERKRIHGLPALARTGAGLGQGLYATASSRRTYEALAAAAGTILSNGFNAIVDATFLRRSERLGFRQLAAATGARFAILDCRAPEGELRRRIVKRAAGGRDASEADLAVLDMQLHTREPLDRAERRTTLRIATNRPISYSNLLKRLVKP